MTKATLIDLKNSMKMHYELFIPFFTPRIGLLCLYLSLCTSIHIDYEKENTPSHKVLIHFKHLGQEKKIVSVF